MPPFPRRAKNFKPTNARIGSRLKRGDVKNCAVLDNGNLLLAAVPGSDGAIVYSKAKAAQKATAVRLSFLDHEGNAAPPVRSIRLASRSSAEAVVQLTLGGEAKVGEASNLSQVSLKLRTGRSFVEIANAQRIAAVRVGAAMRFAFRPDLFGTDVFYAPTMAIFARKDRVPLAIENYLLGVLSPDAAILCTWGTGGQKASLNLSGAGPLSGPSSVRQFTALDIRFSDQQRGDARVSASGSWMPRTSAAGKAWRAWPRSLAGAKSSRFSRNGRPLSLPAGTRSFTMTSQPTAIPVSICRSTLGRWPAEFARESWRSGPRAAKCGRKTTANTNPAAPLGTMESDGAWT